MEKTFLFTREYLQWNKNKWWNKKKEKAKEKCDHKRKRVEDGEKETTSEKLIYERKKKSRVSRDK